MLQYLLITINDRINSTLEILEYEQEIPNTK